MKLPRNSAFFLTGIAVASTTLAIASPPPLSLKPVSTGQLIAPVAITNAGDGKGRLFVCDQPGQIRIISNEMLLPTPFLDISAEVIHPLTASYDERGLLSMAFHPGFANSSSPGFKKFYVFYSAVSPNAPGTATAPVNCRSTVSEFQVSATDPNVVDSTIPERLVIAWDKPQMNHNGGQLAFGPEVGPNGERYLYITVGDGGGQYDNAYGHTGGSSANGTATPTGNLGNAQDTTQLLGKILRIDPLGINGPTGAYGIPVDNPFATTGGGVRPEIYSYGMRNPWRLSFDTDPVLGTRLIEGDVGQDNVEEINLIVNRGNYGWRVMEGTFFNDSTAPGNGGPLINPVAEYAHPTSNLANYPGLTQIGTSVIGGYVYRGSAIPSLVGQYVFADYGTSFAAPGSGRLLALDASSWALGNPVVTSITQPVVAGNTGIFITSMGRDEDGELYVAAKKVLGPDPTTNPPSGTICKIVAAQVATVTLTPVHDNTIFSESSSLSNALGSIYAGETASGAIRRGLLAFDIADNVPAGSVITSAQLSLNMTLTSANGSSNMSLYRLSQSWGEGTSGPSTGAGAPATVGDATWGDRFWSPSSPTTWAVAGGTHFATVSATTSVGTTTGYYSWNSAQLAADVQGWLNTPANNFGWLLIGDETTALTARAFGSRESAAGMQPALQITYAAAPSLTWRDTWLQTYFGGTGATYNYTQSSSTTGTAVISYTGTPAVPLTGGSATLQFTSGNLSTGIPGTYYGTYAIGNPAFNSTGANGAGSGTFQIAISGSNLPTSGSGNVTLTPFFIGTYVDALPDGMSNLLAYAWALSPLVATPPGYGSQSSVTVNGNSQTYTITFLRDPRATDLTYQLQTSSDLVTWTTVAQSTGGGVSTPTGSAFVSEADAAGTPPLKVVTAVETLSAATMQFSRIKVTHTP